MDIYSKNEELKMIKDILNSDSELLKRNLERKSKIINEIQESQVSLITYEKYCINTKNLIEHHKLKIEQLEKEINDEILEHNIIKTKNKNEIENDIINPEEKEKLILFAKHLMSTLIDSGIIFFSENEREKFKLSILSLIDSL